MEDFVVTYENDEQIIKTIEMRGVGSKFYALLYFKTATGIKFNKILSIEEKNEKIDFDYSNNRVSM